MRTVSASVIAALCVGAAFAEAGCSGNSGAKQCGSGVICGTVDGGYDGGSAFTIIALPSNANNATLPLAISLASDGRIGVAYFWFKDASDQELDVLEIETDGTYQSAYIDTVQRQEGVGFAYDLSGVPYVAYLGDDTSMAAPAGADGGLFWIQSDLGVGTVLALTDGGVVHTFPAHSSDDVMLPTDPMVATTGLVVGLSPAVVATDAGMIVTYRDIHNGQFLTDYSKSNWNAAVGTYAGWVDERIQIGTDSAIEPHGGIGALSKIVNGSSGVAAICAGEPSLDGTPSDIIFSARFDGGWHNTAVIETVNNDGPAGPSLAEDAVEGFGVAWVEMQPVGTAQGSAILSFTTSTDGRTWINSEEVYGSGSGGWEPSLAYNASDQATIAYYVCSQTPGIATCPAGEQGLWLATRRAPGVWDQTLIDPAGGRLPQLLYDSNGDLAVVYHDPASGALKLARPSTP